MFLPPRLQCLLALASVATPSFAQYVERISVVPGGTETNGHSGHASISDDGRQVLFDSLATNLIAGSAPTGDSFLVDRQLGTLQFVTSTLSGTPSAGVGIYYGRSLSADGRLVVFQSGAPDLVPGDTNQKSDVFVRDVASGVVTRVSVSSAGVEGNGHSVIASSSATGRFVVFYSAASNLVAGDTNGVDDVFVHDLQTGITTRESVSFSGVEGDDSSWNACISADGSVVAFTSRASNLVPNDTNGTFDLFVRQRNTGKIERVNVGPFGEQSNSSGFMQPSMSQDGTRIVFNDVSSNLVLGDTNGQGDVFVRDLATRTTRLVSVSTDNIQGDANSTGALISSDGRYVTFTSTASNLVFPPTNGSQQVYVKDLVTGALSLISQREDGVRTSFGAANSPLGSARFAAFTAVRLSPSDVNALRNVYVVDLAFLPIDTFCAGDGMPSVCPCGFTGAPLHGCANSAVPEGAWLRAGGQCGMSNDTVQLRLQGATGSICTFYQGTAAIAPLAIDDGLTCVGGTLVRLASKPIAGGTSDYPGTGDPSVSVRGGVLAQVGTRYYQAVYRNVAQDFCPPGSSNRSNGVIVRWVP